MGIGYYRRLKAPAILFIIVLAWLISFQSAPADARANLTAYTTTPPNAWQMKGFNVSGSAPLFIRDTLGWNNTRMLGNVGLGNGSLQALNASSNRVINYSEQYTMAADITTAPFDRSRLDSVSISGAGIEPGYESNITEQQFESEVGRDNAGSGIASIEEDTPAASSENETSGRGRGSSNIPLNDPYHSILLGRPVNDMLYEHPHGIATNMYGRLLGLPISGGTYANIAIRAIGYGY